MPKKNLLEVVQTIAYNINSDEVDSFQEGSIEIDDIRRITLDTLEDIINRNDWEFLRDRVMKASAGSTALSVTAPGTVRHVQNLRYRIMEAGQQTGFRTLTYLTPDDYLCRLQNNKPTDPDTATITIGDIEVYPRTNRPPRYYTSFDEKELFLDSYDSSYDATGIDVTNTTLVATIYMDFTGSDDEEWVAPIPESLFPLWIQEASAEASVVLRQSENPRAERQARRTYVQTIKREPLTQRDEGSKEVNYGR